MDEYISGKVIAIGSGKDLVCHWAERFDLGDGDLYNPIVWRALGDRARQVLPEKDGDINNFSRRDLGALFAEELKS